MGRVLLPLVAATIWAQGLTVAAQERGADVAQVFASDRKSVAAEALQDWIDKADCARAQAAADYLRLHRKEVRQRNPELLARLEKGLAQALTASIEKGLHACAEAVIQMGASARPGDYPADNPLWQAIRQSDLRMVQLLFASGATLESGFEKGNPYVREHLHPPVHDTSTLGLLAPLAPLLGESHGMGLGYLASGIAEIPYHATTAVALERGDAGILRFLLQQVSRLSLRQRELIQNTIWLYPRFIKSRELVDALLEAGYTISGDKQPKEWTDGYGKGISSVLAEAIEQRNGPLVDYLLNEKKVSLLWYWRTEIWIAVEQRDLALLRRLLEHQRRIDPSWLRASGKGLDSRAAYDRPISLMRYVLGGRLLIEHQQWAVELVDTLLEYGADWKSSEDGVAQFEWVAGLGYPALMAVFLKHGLSPNATAGDESLLLSSLRQGHFGAAELLANAGADLKAQGRRGQSALHLCAGNVARGETAGLAMLDRLLRAGLDPNAEPAHDFPPLAKVVVSSYVRGAHRRGAQGVVGAEAIRRLCRAGADPNWALEKKSLTELAMDNDFPEAVQALRECGARATGIPELQQAVFADDAARVRALLGPKPEPGAADLYLATAIEQQRLAAAEALLQGGANPNAVGPNRYSPPICGAESMPALRLLLRHGADANARCSEWARVIDHVRPRDQRRLLLQQGADPRLCAHFDELLKDVLRAGEKGVEPDGSVDLELAEQFFAAAQIDLARAADRDRIRAILEHNGSSHYARLLLPWYRRYVSRSEERVRLLLAGLSTPKSLDDALQDLSPGGDLRSLLKQNNVSGLRTLLAIHPEPGAYTLWGVGTDAFYEYDSEEPDSLGHRWRKDRPRLQAGPEFFELLLKHRVTFNSDRNLESLVKGLVLTGHAALAQKFIAGYKLEPDAELRALLAKAPKPGRDKRR